MNATNAFFIWFFTGLNGLGGWFIFMLLALAAVALLLYDTSRRRLPALGWKSGVLLLAALILPAVVFRFSGADTQDSLMNFIEAIFYLGLIGGLLPVVLDIGYLVTYHGMVGCPQGHVYPAQLNACPDCARLAPPPPAPIIHYEIPAPQPAQDPAPRRAAPQPSIQKPPAVQVTPLPPTKPKAQAWLVTDDGRSYQLYCGETTLGRTSINDIQLTGDSTVSRQHAKIIEQNGYFRLVDVGSTSGTRLNDQLIHQMTLLEPDDEIRLGDNTVVRFVTVRRQ